MSECVCVCMSLCTDRAHHQLEQCVPNVLLMVCLCVQIVLTMEKQVSGSWPNLVRWRESTS